MKMVMISCSEAITTDVMDALHAAGAANYTEFIGTTGKGTASGPHFGTSVWPKLNRVIMVAAEDDVVEKVIAGINQLRETLRQEGVKAFVLPIEQMT